MSLMKPLDEKFPIQRQLGIEAAPVVLINVFTLDAADEPVFLDAWKDDAEFMKRQPGFISTQLHSEITFKPKPAQKLLMTSAEQPRRYLYDR